MREFITRHGAGAAVSRAKKAVWFLTSPQHNEVLMFLLSHMSFAISVCGGVCACLLFLVGPSLGRRRASQPGPFLSVLQSYWILRMWTLERRCGSLEVVGVGERPSSICE